MKFRLVFILIYCLIWICFPQVWAKAEIDINHPITIRMLVDNSGSMYPGYRLRGRDKKRITHVGFFHEYPEFREKLATLMREMKKFNCEKISMSVFTEKEIERILDPTPCENVTGETLKTAFGKLRKRNGRFKTGQNTELTENLETFINGFEGIVLLVTDNIIETRTGSHENEDMKNFFQTINDKPVYKSLHAFKYPFEDREKGKHSNLVVYGMLVSPVFVNPGLIEFFDRKFRDLESLFPERLQFKDLTIAPVDIDAPIKVGIITKKTVYFSTSQRVRFIIDGEIKSNLTQHSITDGKYIIKVSEAFKADKASVDEFGVPPIISQKDFQIIRGRFSLIPPKGSMHIKKELASERTFTMTPSKFLGFFKAAFGFRVTYTGKIAIQVPPPLNVRFERNRLKGVYGIDEAYEIFENQKLKNLDKVYNAPTTKSFVLEGGGASALILLILCFLFLTALLFILWLMFIQKESCEIEIESRRETVDLKRMRTYPLKNGSIHFAGLKRSMGNSFFFVPSPALPRLSIKSRQNDAGIVDITIKEAQFVVKVKPLTGGNVEPINFTKLKPTRNLRSDSPPKPPRPGRSKSSASNKGKTSERSSPKSSPKGKKTSPSIPKGPPIPPRRPNRRKPN